MPSISKFLSLTCVGTGFLLPGLGMPGHAQAQRKLDRSDPTIVEQVLPKPMAAQDETSEIRIEAGAAVTGETSPITGTITAVVVDGGDRRDAAAYASTYLSVIGEKLNREQLGSLAGRIADVARRRGYPFASASIGAQRMTGGVLRVSIDLGKVDAVRVIGGQSAAADAILYSALVTGAPVRTAQLEQAVLLVSDLPGVRVTGSRYARQSGFGILLVTIETDRASAYAQIDNRGSAEVGPVRSTLLANVRNVLHSGDELAFLTSQTPIQPSEFVFLRARYGAPIDQAGSILSVSGSYGRSHPGASLKRLDVIGRSTDVAVGYSQPLWRSRARSLWATAEFRAVSVEQTLAGRQLRDDRLASLTGAVNGFTKAGPGVLRAEIGATTGLSLPGVTHEGDPRTSRADGDARFVLAGFTADWTVQISPPVSIVIAAAGQLASRPLLATMEIGVGGPGFARGYDYAERTGDKGIMGSVELRRDMGRMVPGLLERVQIYGFVDGGQVGNVRGGVGGGRLFSTGAGLRLGLGRADGMVEVALPIEADRFDSGDRRPRISLRLSRAF